MLDAFICNLKQKQGAENGTGSKCRNERKVRAARNGKGFLFFLMDYTYTFGEQMGKTNTTDKTGCMNKKPEENAPESGEFTSTRRLVMGLN